MAGKNVLEFTDANFQTEVLESSEPVLVDFWAAWCGPCRMLAPTIESIADKYAGRVKVGKLNVDENQRVAGSYRIEGIPTVVLFRDGEPVQSLVGVQPESSFDQLLAPWAK